MVSQAPLPLMAVSYTHLIIIDKTQLTPARILTGYVVVGVLLSALAVSYTHLDVYKRQPSPPGR